MSIEEIIETLAEEYGIKPKTIKRYYDMLKEYPAFDDRDAMKCLSLICEDRVHAVVQMQILYESSKHGLCVRDAKPKFKSVQAVVDDVIREVYEERYEAMENFSGNSMIYDETEYDVMEREDQVEDVLYKYIDEMEDIRTKDNEAYQKMKKKNQNKKD